MTVLLSCPWCAAGTTLLKENGKQWLGMKYSEPISVSVQHWCEPEPGQPSRMIERIGRDESAAIAAWNRRAATPAQPVEGWIDLNSSMPEPEVFVMTWDGRKVAVDWWGSLRHRGDGVTHWMPFPAPPNAGPMYGTHSIAAPQAAPTEESIGSVIRAGVGEK